MASRVSVCLLTRNDEKNLPRVLGSVRDVADEVIVAESGSTDATAEVARGLGAKVVPFNWDDDFAAGRNVALRAASGDWVLWLNPDEELLPGSAPQVRLLQEAGAKAFGFLSRIRDVANPDRPEEFSETWDFRLFRRRPDAVYVGRAHPIFRDDLPRTIAAEGLNVHPSELIIRRHGYLSVLDKGKLRWAARILRRELEDRPGRFRYVVEYGRTLLLLGDTEAHRVLAEALDQLTPSLEAPSPPSADAAPLLEYVLTCPPGDYRGGLTPDRARELALRWFPNNPPLLWRVAEPYFRAGQFRPAAVVLDQLVRLGQTGGYDRAQGFDPRIVGAWAVLNLGDCYRALGDSTRARQCYERLLGDHDYEGEARERLGQIGAGIDPGD
jgi:hypothetical protein